MSTQTQTEPLLLRSGGGGSGGGGRVKDEEEDEEDEDTPRPIAWLFFQQTFWFPQIVGFTLVGNILLPAQVRRR